MSSGGVSDVGEVVTGVAVPEGVGAPDVSGVGALRKAVGAASALYCPDTRKATAGIHLARVLEALGLGGAEGPQLREFPNGQTAMAEMAKDADPRTIGCTQVTEILNTPGVSYAGPLPPPHDLSTVYTAAVAADAAAPEAARKLIALLTDPANAELRRGVGFT